MISVCIATYNGEKYIKEQLKSILDQLSCEDEIIISDDGSTDNTVSIILSLNDKRIHLLCNQIFHNPVLNFENALKSCRGDYIFLSDQDDVWLPEKVKLIQEAFLEGNDLIISDCRVVDESLNVIRESYYDFNRSRPGFIKNLIKNSYMGCCMAMTRKVLDKCLPFPKGIPMHDSFIGLMAELRFKVCFLKYPLILHRKHSLNTSSTSSGVSSYGFITKVSFRLRLLWAIVTKVIF